MDRAAIRLPLIVLIAAVAALVLAALGSIYANVPTDVLTDDPAAIAGFHPLTGALSNLGVLLWCSTAAICAFASVVLFQTPRATHASKPMAGWFLGCSALLTLVLLFDDLFLFHEALAQRYLALRQDSVYLGLMAVTAAYLVMFRGVIRRSDYAILCLALVLLASSAAMDMVFAAWLKPRLGHWESLVEDGTKLLGIACWFSYYTRVSYVFVTRRR